LGQCLEIYLKVFIDIGYLTHPIIALLDHPLYGKP
jgi:hypothetical protein